MAAVTTASLFTEGRCYACLGLSQAETLKITLLANFVIQLNPMALTTVNELLEYGKCYACLGLTLADTLEISLLSQISVAGGGSGFTFGNYAGVAPNFTPATGEGAAVDTSNGTVWYYYSGAWH